MELVEVEVISRDTIKPSSPTPSYLRHHRLSFLDQIAPPVFMPLLLFYPQTTTTTTSSFTTQLQKTNNLKTSLSQTLTKFYPLAGRLVNNNTHVDCSDAGVPYTVARAHGRLSHLISDPIPSEMSKFLPCELGDCGDIPLAVRVNIFDCGGMVVSYAISHKVVDAFSSIFFLNSWAAAAAGRTCNVPPSPWLGGAELFPPTEMAGFNPRTGMVKDPIVGFLFTASKIASVVDKCTDTSSPDQKRPTRTEALSAFVWSRFMASIHSTKDPQKIYNLLHAVNLRPRTNPPLPDHSFGNIFRIAITIPSIKGEQPPKCDEIVKQVRDAIRKVDVEYVRMLGEASGNHLCFLKEMAEMFSKGELVSLNFTSLCGFPTYKADFGWGKPAWVSTSPMPFQNLVVFMDTHSGDGIEAWVNLKAEDMAKFEVDDELLAFVSSPTN